MALQYLLNAVGLVLAALSTLFLSRTFLLVGSADLCETGAGAILSDGEEVFGFRRRLVQTACRQRADSMVGLCMLFLGMLTQLVALFMPTSFAPVSRTTVLVCALVVAACAFTIGRLCARAGARSFLEAKIREQIMKEVQPANLPHRDALLASHYKASYGNDIAQLLSGLSSPERIDRFTSRLFAEFEERFLALEPESAAKVQPKK